MKPFLSEDSDMKHHQNGLTLVGFILVIALVTGTYFGYKTYVKRELEKAQEAARVQVNDAKTKMADIRQRFTDAVKLASSTSRIALAAPVANLQSIQREAAGLPTPTCLYDARNKLADAFGLQVEGFLTFMRNEGLSGEVDALDLFKESTQKIDAHLKLLEDKQTCERYLSGKGH